MTEMAQKSDQEPNAKIRQSGGFEVNMGEEALEFRHITAGLTSKTNGDLTAEPKRPAGLHGPATGPGLLSNHVVTSMVRAAVQLHSPDANNPILKLDSTTLTPPNPNPHTHLSARAVHGLELRTEILSQELL